MVEIAAPVGGTVVEVHVSEGDAVEKDTHLFTLERAKTLLIVRSTVRGVVAKFEIAVGDNVDTDQVAVIIDESDS
ncbi:acetyl-CoA carboxylase biotin carboxyl carrier protein subunit [Sinorhizobium sp. BJ1]|uniref:acetyl-CoA carboxylase biotin carboxyl carrier protein subunit n=1 Tax=Sinorhizobium sp. BJ1 TaxID=2035455 RepID=UPI000BE8F4E5|nr:acetyl-CoA carboxylase biotin carboxyl carrier protein subunit [Sinorhizobium sp. BJ1]PDT81370.1 acetyl-CoA carboxylase biotin carboxyl carrier protein subunit [Sinorhizobium sp. BJ1]